MALITQVTYWKYHTGTIAYLASEPNPVLCFELGISNSTFILLSGGQNSWSGTTKTDTLTQAKEIGVVELKSAASKH
ncbi:MAG: hypothetical protein DLM72_10095 [Candidatus Nitrosopolaris wilkensis]|nr:MAG: hypothetical protein DLM72_10095 [Candidatus Nitrosopolaris wilkensis]